MVRGMESGRCREAEREERENLFSRGEITARSAARELGAHPNHQSSTSILFTHRQRSPHRASRGGVEGSERAAGHKQTAGLGTALGRARAASFS